MPSTVTVTAPPGGTATGIVTDDAAAAIALAADLITAQMAANTFLITGPGASTTNSLYAINNSIAELVGRLGATADVSKGLSKALSDLDVAITAMTSAVAVGNSLQASMIANQIKSNNFQVQATKEALIRTGQPVPEEPSMREQITENVKEGIIVTETAVVTGAITSQVAATVTTTGEMIAGTAVYKTITVWVKKAGDSIFQLLPESVQTALSKKSAQTGVPS